MNIGDHVAVLRRGLRTSRTGVIVRVTSTNDVFVEMDEGITDHGRLIKRSIESFNQNRLAVIHRVGGGDHIAIQGERR